MKNVYFGESETLFKDHYGNHKNSYEINVKKRSKIIQGVLKGKTLERNIHNKVEVIVKMQRL